MTRPYFNAAISSQNNVYARQLLLGQNLYGRVLAGTQNANVNISGMGTAFFSARANVGGTFNFNDTRTFFTALQNFTGTITAGVQNNRWSFGNQFQGNLTFGDGRNTVIMKDNAAGTVNGGHGTNTWDIGKNFKGIFNVGDGNNTAKFKTGFEGTLTFGNGRNKFTFGDDIKGGSLTAGDGGNTITLGRNAKDFTVQTGDGRDLLHLYDNFSGLTINTDNGDDEIMIENNTDVNNMRKAFGTNTHINAGAGHDTVYLRWMNADDTNYVFTKDATGKVTLKDVAADKTLTFEGVEAFQLNLKTLTLDEIPLEDQGS